MVTQLHFSVTNETAQLTAPDCPVLTSGSNGSYECIFTLDSHWGGMSLEAVFLATPASWNGGESAVAIRRAVPLTHGTAILPAPVLTKAGYVLYAGISGIAGGVEKRSTMALVGRIRQGADPEDSHTDDISQNRYQVLLEKIEALGSVPETPAVTIAEPSDTDIPRVFFGSALPQTKTETVMPFRYVSGSMDISGYCKTKAQGNSSMSYPKKNQTVKLFQDEDCTKKLKLNFKGWGKQSKYCFKANWIDITHARNIVSARLWGDIVKSREGYNTLPEALRTSPNQGAIDGFPVKVYAGGVYLGRYTLNIPKDKWMTNMDDSLDTNCILCGENYVSGCFRGSASINGSDWSDEIHDTVPDAIKTRWNQVISFVMNSSDEEFVSGLSNYFYVDSLIDYHLFGLMSCGMDAYGKNQLYMTYDGQRWIASMYDMDSTWGLWWNGTKFVATDYDRSAYEDMNGRDGNLLYIRLEKLFYEQLQTRWAQLRQGALSLDNILNRFEQFMDIAPASLVAEDYASTTGSGSFTNIPSKTTNHIQQLRAYIVSRRTWCDSYVAGLTPVPTVACTGISLSAETLTFTEATTQTLVATTSPEGCTDPVSWESSSDGVATVSEGVVTPVGNGEATITATCGSYSATCSVSVSGIGDEGGSGESGESGTQTPLYPLPDGVSSFTNNTVVTVTNGNHVKVEQTDKETPKINAYLSNITNSTGDSYDNVAYQDKLFSLSTGDVVSHRIYNITMTDALTDNLKGMYNGSVYLQKSDNTAMDFTKMYFKTLATNGTTEVSGQTTVSGDCDIGFVGLYMGSRIQPGSVLEFDLEFSVNGVRYV